MSEPPQTSLQPRPHCRWHHHQRSVASRSGLVYRVSCATGENFSGLHAQPRSRRTVAATREFRAAYRRARFVTADGFPIVVLSRLTGTRIERTTGADLVEPFCAEARKKGLPVFLLGANNLTLEETARRLSKQFQGLKIAGCLAPGPGFDPYSERSRCCDRAYSRLGRQTLLRRVGRAAAGNVRGAVPRRTEGNRRVVHRRRPRFHRRHAEPRAIHRAQDRA